MVFQPQGWAGQGPGGPGCLSRKVALQGYGARDTAEPGMLRSPDLGVHPGIEVIRVEEPPVGHLFHTVTIL